MPNIDMQLKQLNQTMDRLVKLLDPIYQKISKPHAAEPPQEIVIQLKPDSKYMLLFSEDTDLEAMVYINEQLFRFFNGARVFVIGGLKLENVIEVKDDHNIQNG